MREASLLLKVFSPVLLSGRAFFVLNMKPRLRFLFSDLGGHRNCTEPVASVNRENRPRCYVLGTAFEIPRYAARSTPHAVRQATIHRPRTARSPTWTHPEPPSTPNPPSGRWRGRAPRLHGPLRFPAPPEHCARSGPPEPAAPPRLRQF